MSITPDHRKTVTEPFVPAIRIAGIKCVNRGKRTGIQVELHRRRGGSFAALSGYSESKYWSDPAPALNSRRVPLPGNPVSCKPAFTRVTVLIQLKLSVTAVEHRTIAVHRAENRSG